MYFFKSFVKLKNGDIGFPSAKKIAPFIYILLSFLMCLCLGTTIYYFLRSDTYLHSQNKVILPSKPNLPGTRPIDHLESAILKRNIFNLDGTLPDASNEQASCTGTPLKSRLAYKVTGIIFGGDAKHSTALLKKTSEQEHKVYKLGDALPEGPVISNITQDKVFITSTQCPEYFEIPVSTLVRNNRVSVRGSTTTYEEAGFERTGNTTNVTKQWVNEILTTKLPSILQEAHAVPYIEGGQIKGFLLNQIIPNSVYSKLGLQNGDVVTAINGIELNDAARAIQTLNSMRTENKIDLQITRGGQPVNLKVNIQ